MFSDTEMAKAVDAGAKAQHEYFRARAFQLRGLDVPAWEDLPPSNRDEARASFRKGFAAAVASLKDGSESAI